ncbi:L,D-transpeptidase family protein [Hyphomicrobium sp.]|uniref:L,D-transpeptidase family protein n=1 Tax=Hyphomicrobium sp. TaxID=82 RepID=UPI000F9D4F35|nr:L,D-transpeptidase family protein [Hyphomicrobium sp.]RUO99047.1 MAG: L,D-transpeptidase [Hyphomicrobium sp.]
MFSLPFRRPHLARQSALLALAILICAAATHPADAERRRSRSSDDVLQDTINGQAMLAVVSIRDQRVTIYDANGGAVSSRVSSGRTGYETPVGVYSVLQKEEEHFSNIYDDASMPFMQRLTWSGIALHAGQLPGYPASHGCVRMPEGFAQRLFPMTKVGMRVVVAYDDVAPVEISHPLLMKPTPQQDIHSAAVAIPMSYQDPDSSDSTNNAFEPDLRNWPARQAELEALKSLADGKRILADAAVDQAKEMEQAIAEKKEPRDRAAKALHKAEAAKKSADDRIAKTDKALSTAKSDKVKKNLEAAKAKAAKDSEAAAAKVAAATDVLKAAEADLQAATQTAAPALAARDAAVAAFEDAKRKAKPISVFISLKTQRLYVRQGYEPVFDAPITISEPDKPIGTHVFTAVDYTKGGQDIRWMAVSLEHRGNDYASNDDRRQRLSDAEAPPATDLNEASAALNRITIPPDVAAKLSSAVWPGSSLIVSDEAVSKETGKSTDFVVLISTEPQGGIKKRPKQFFRNDNFYGDSADDFYYGYDRYGRRQAYPRQKSFFGWW